MKGHPATDTAFAVIALAMRDRDEARCERAGLWAETDP
jgi:hypothetical protein